MQRKIGPGQYVSYTSTGVVDPVYTIGDLSTVWIVAYVRESEAPKVAIGQQLDFTVLAYPKTTFKRQHRPRRRIARSEHPPADGARDDRQQQRPVQARDVRDRSRSTPTRATARSAVPRDAVIYEADKARVWVARNDKTIEVRQIKTGITRGDMIQVLQGLQPGETVVTKGSLFVDQAAGSSLAGRLEKSRYRSAAHDSQL